MIEKPEWDEEKDKKLVYINWLGCTEREEVKSPNIRTHTTLTVNDNQLINGSQNVFTAPFDIKASEDGKYSFTSNVGTASSGVTLTLGYINEAGEYIASEKLDITNTGSFTDTRDYTWNFDLEADQVYNFKLTGNTPSGYCRNIYRWNI